MNDYGESSIIIMTWRRKMLEIHFVKTGSLEGKLLSKGAAATQNCLENTTARNWEYRTNVNGRLAVEWLFREYFETIGRF